jgi:hypothetical protein
MAEPSRNDGRKWINSPSDALNLEEFRNALKSLIENPSDENLHRINHIRRWFVHQQFPPYYDRFAQTVSRPKDALLLHKPGGPVSPEVIRDPACLSANIYLSDQYDFPEGVS